MRYLSRFFARHKIIYTILILLLVISCTLLGCMLDKGNKVKASADVEEEKAKATDCQMFMSESLSDSVFYSYMEDGSEEFYQFQAFLNELEAENSFTYIVQSNQFLEVKDPAIPNIFLEGYEFGEAEGSIFEDESGTIYAVKTLQVSKRFFEKYSISVEEGRLFSEEDYQYSKVQPVPVLLGAAYKDVFQLGDIIEAGYLFQDLQFQVIGFLENSAFYYSWNSNEFTSCERYILMPVFQNLPNDEFGKRALLQYFTAYIESERSYGKVHEKIQNMMRENGISEEDINLVDSNEEEQQVNILQTYSAMTSAVSKYFGVIIGIMVVCIGFILTIVLTNMIQEENYNFGIYIMCGMKKRKLAALIFMFDSVITGIGDFIVILLLVINKISLKSILLVQIVVILVLLASFFACYLRLQKIDIAKLIGGKE